MPSVSKAAGWGSESSRIYLGPRLRVLPSPLPLRERVPERSEGG